MGTPNISNPSITNPSVATNPSQVVPLQYDLQSGQVVIDGVNSTTSVAMITPTGAEPNGLTAGQLVGMKTAVGSVVAGRPYRMRLGDSWTQYCSTCGNTITNGTVPVNFTSQQWAWYGTEWDCESGAGALTYDAAARTLQWTPNGGAAGAPVDSNKTGMILVPGGVTNHGVWIIWYGASVIYTSGTSSLTVNGNGGQTWQYPSTVQGSYMQWEQAYGRAAYQLAPAPGGLPPGTDGLYGLGGGTAQTLVDASWQWLPMATGVDVLDVVLGTNDAQSVPVATYVLYIQRLCNLAWGVGVRTVKWYTPGIRNTDTDANGLRAWKATAAQLMIAWQKTVGSRLEVVDIATPVTQITAGASQGQWITNMSNDGIHPANYGAMAIGRVGGRKDRLPSVQSIIFGSVGDVFHAVNNPNGNILNAVAAGSGSLEGIGGTFNAGAGVLPIAVAAWAASSATVGAAVGQPCIANGNLYICMTAGTTGTVAPIHTQGVALDGSVVWQFIAVGARGGLGTGWSATPVLGTTMKTAFAKILRTDGPGEFQYVCCWGAAGGAGQRDAVQMTTVFNTTGIVLGGQYSLDGEVIHHQSSALNTLALQGLINNTGRGAACGIQPANSDYFHADEYASTDILPFSIPPRWPVTVGGSSIKAGFSVGTRTGGYAVIGLGNVALRRTA